MQLRGLAYVARETLRRETVLSLLVVLVLISRPSEQGHASIRSVWKMLTAASQSRETA